MVVTIRKDHMLVEARALFGLAHMHPQCRWEPESNIKNVEIWDRAEEISPTAKSLKWIIIFCISHFLWKKLKLKRRYIKFHSNCLSIICFQQMQFSYKNLTKCFSSFLNIYEIFFICNPVSSKFYYIHACFNNYHHHPYILLLSLILTILTIKYKFALIWILKCKIIIKP